MVIFMHSAGAHQLGVRPHPLFFGNLYSAPPLLRVAALYFELFDAKISLKWK
jgi:hypothetical protein